MDCLGQNGVIIGAKSLQFTKSQQILSKEISHYVNVITYLSIHKKIDISKNKFFLISNEPKEIRSPEHTIWEKIQNIEQPFSVIHPEEAGQVVDSINISKAGKFIESSN